MPIGKDLGVDTPVPYSTNKTKSLKVDGPDPTLLYGVELEIEGLGHLDHPEKALVAGMAWHEDGSLRNHGAEYITKPMTYQKLTYILYQFFQKNKLDENNYSERTSTHVHTNVTDMTWEQLYTLILVYMVFERVLFNFVGNERDKNIFCVPLHETNIVKAILYGEGNANEVIQRTSRWQKYTALNFLPIRKQGSIEWRHLHGTHDMKTIMTWCRLIGHIYVFARNVKYQDCVQFFSELNTSSAYNEAVQRVFKEDSYILQGQDGFSVCMEEGVMHAKYAIGRNLEKQTTLEDLLRRQQEAPQNVEVRWDAGDVFVAHDANPVRRVRPAPPPVREGVEDIVDGVSVRYLRTYFSENHNRWYEGREYEANMPPSWIVNYIVRSKYVSRNVTKPNGNVVTIYYANFWR